MANPNISLLGAAYSAVSGVTLPKQGGGTATFPWVEGSQTITENGTYDVSSLSEAVVNVSGGGGASNIVSGTFKGTTANSVLTIALPYSGSGYPIGIIIHPVSGCGDTSSDFGALVQRYALALFVSSKLFAQSAPTYSANINSNQMMAFTRYKDSNTTAKSYSNGNNAAALILYNTDPSNSSSGTYAVRICSNTQMRVLIAGTSYGFAANIDYAYHVIYSS